MADNDGVSSHEGPHQTTQADNSVLARSFGAVAEQYSRLRPGYPTAALDVICNAGPGRAGLARAGIALDLAAGTGQLTGDLTDRGYRVVAVEPSAGMARQLRIRRPQALVVRGRAEQIPLPGGLVEVITVGQAFHWFSPEQALAEMARVCRPGGRVGLLWNADDPADELSGGLQSSVRQLLGRKLPGEDSAAPQPQSPFAGSTEFVDITRTVLPWTQRRTVAETQELFRTYSWVSTAPVSMQLRVDELIATRLAGCPTDDRARVASSQLCEVWSATRVPT